MDHVIICIHPFIMRQEVMVYQNGVCVKHTDCTMDEVAKVCYNLCKEYNIHRVDLAGVIKYCSKIKEDLLTPDKYDNFEFEFNFY